MNISQTNYPKARAYCKAWRTAKRIAAETPARSLVVFRGWFPDDAATVYNGFIAALHARINQRGGVTFAGRKYSENYQNDMMRDCWTIRDNATRRIIVRPRDIRTAEVKRRFAHIVTQPWEE